MNTNGLLLCSRYALPPNSLRYCGPDKVINLFSYTKEQIADLGLQEILTEFETLYPYLSFIAYENNIRDPFDHRVVEAYWLGNKLLHNISMNGFFRHFSEALHLEKKIKKKDFELLVGKIPAGAIPFHTFHVLNVFTRTGYHTVPHTLETMDSCRISWGKLMTQRSNLKSQILDQNSKIKNNIQVLTKPLILQNGKLALGKPVIKEIQCDMFHVPCSMLHDKWISFHWNQFCDVLTREQVTNLERYTNHSINLANQTL